MFGINIGHLKVDTDYLFDKVIEELILNEQANKMGKKMIKMEMKFPDINCVHKIIFDIDHNFRMRNFKLNLFPKN